MTPYLKITAFSLLLATASFAQTAAPSNPLKPAAPPAATTPAPAVMPKAATPAKKAEAPAEKPKRERSEKQKANDDLMRKCGAEWRADKAAGKTGTTQWRDYLQTCRKKNKPA